MIQIPISYNNPSNREECTTDCPFGQLTGYAKISGLPIVCKVGSGSCRLCIHNRQLLSHETHYYIQCAHPDSDMFQIDISRVL